MHRYDWLIFLTVALPKAGNYSLKESEVKKQDCNLSYIQETYIQCVCKIIKPVQMTREG